VTFKKRMTFKKIGVLWAKLDKNGKQFMSGMIDKDVTITLAPKQQIYVFQTDPAKRTPKSPMATIVVGVEGEAYVAPVVEEPVAEDMPEPLPDDTGDAPF
jgi:hypothetical protein